MAAQNAQPLTAPSIFRPAHLAWLPALMGIAVICGESTNTMGAGHTGIWLNQLFATMGHPNGPIGLLNHLLRKGGHFTGYGLLGLCFARARPAGLRADLGVACIHGHRARLRGGLRRRLYGNLLGRALCRAGVRSR